VTLDPENWEEMKELGHRMLDDLLENLEIIRNRPYQLPTDETRSIIQVPLPVKGDGEEKVYDIFKKYIVPSSPIFIRPDFWSGVGGSGSPFGMLTDMAISGINTGSIFMFFITNQALDWIKELLEYPMEAGGVFLASGSEANYTGLAVARNKKAEVDMKTQGMQAVPRRMTLYCSEEAHHCLERSAELLGLGNDALRWIKTDNDRRIKLDSLKASIEDDRKHGYHPFCVIGTAGTVNSGTFDDLNSLAALSKKEDLWFHVDGAFGSWVKLSETHKHLTDGLHHADSLAVDLHKWMSMPFGIACTLVKDRLAHFSTFVYGHEAEYLKTGKEWSGDRITNPLDLSLALSRPDYGLKAYMLLRAYGRDKYSKLVQQNIDQIHYLADLVDREPNLEMTVPVVSNIACFRYIHESLSEIDLEKLNRDILSELWKINVKMFNDTKIKGKHTLRVCNVNHRTTNSDFDILVERITSKGDKLVKDYL